MPDNKTRRGPDAIPAARHAAIWMIAGSFAFAIMSALTYALGKRCDWLLIAFVRAAFMFAASILMAHAKGVKLALWEPRTLWVRSTAGSLSLVCNFYAMTRLPIADVLTLANTYPLWIIVLSTIMTGARPSPAEALGVVMGLAGVALIQQPHLGGDRTAGLVALLGSGGTAVAMLGLHRLRGVDARAIVAHFAGMATIVSGSALLTRGHLAALADDLAPTTCALLAALAISGTIGQFFLTKAYAAGPPGEVAVIGLSQVIFGMGFDVLLWGRALTPATLAGMALILTPTAWLIGHNGRKLASAADQRAGPPVPAPRPPA